MAVSIECPNCSTVFTAEDKYVSDSDEYICPDCNGRVLVDLTYEEPEEEEDNG